MIFINENDTLKWADQLLSQNHFTKAFTDGKYYIDCKLTSFKNMLYRSLHYLQSEIEDKKRIFKTMEKDKDRHIMIAKTDKP
jgi:hypothetical protein